MRPFIAELLGTMLLIVLGNGVVANVVLNRSKGQNGGWIVITTGWSMGVVVAVYAVGAISGAHLNPAVSVGLAAIGKFAWAEVPAYVVGQIAGAFLGSVIVWLAYLPHWEVTEDQGVKLAAFCTSPAVRRPLANLMTEVIGTFVLVLGALALLSPKNLVPKTGFETAFAPVLVGALVWSIGLSLGGPTGYAINPARDLGPRLAHFVLPVAGKGTSDWRYAWVPVVGPLIGGPLGAVFYTWMWPGA